MIRPRPRLDGGGFLLWLVAIAVALGMAWLDLHRMAERGELERETERASEAPSLPPNVQAVEVISEAQEAGQGAETVDAGAR